MDEERSVGHVSDRYTFELIDGGRDFGRVVDVTGVGGDIHDQTICFGFNEVECGDNPASLADGCRDTSNGGLVPGRNVEAHGDGVSGTGDCHVVLWSFAVLGETTSRYADPMASNLELAGIFAEMATLTKIADGSTQSFRARAYESAAKTLEGLSAPAEKMSQAELMDLKGIGKASASRIEEFIATAAVVKLDELRAAFPPDFLELVRIPGLGPKTAILLRDGLDVNSVADLKLAIENELVRELPGLGKKTEENLARSVKRLGLTGKDRRTPILDAMREARRLVAELEAVPGVQGSAVLREPSQVP